MSIYNPDKQLSGSGKVIDTRGADDTSTTDTGVIDTRTKPDTGEGAGTGDKPDTGAAAVATDNEPTAEQKLEAEKIAEAQKGMTPEQIDEDNKARASAADETPEAKELRETNERTAQEAQKKIADEAFEKAMAVILEKAGVKTLDELQDRIPKADETPEQKLEREQKLKANVAQFAVNHKLMSMDEITAFENMSKADKVDLAKSEFSKIYKETHKDRTDTDGTTKIPVTAAEIEDAFNDQFHINSDNAALKKTGEKLLETYIGSLKGDIESRYNDAVADYQEFEAKKAFFPTFKTFLKAVVTGVPAELTFGEGDKIVKVPTEKFDIASIEKIYNDDPTYNAFYAGKGDQKTRDQLQKAFTNSLIAHNINIIQDAAYQAGLSEGKKTTAVGATAPFVEKKPTGDNSAPAPVDKDQYRKDQAKHYRRERV